MNQYTKMNNYTQNIDGKIVSTFIKNNLKDNVIRLKENYNITPGLAAVLVGNRKDSETYVRMKCRTCESLGIYSITVRLSDTCSEQELIDKITELNEDSKIHGILVQLPLPKHIDEGKVLQHVSPNKDVDGFRYASLGRLAVREQPLFVPCTPEGCISMLDYYNISIEGKHAVVIGRSKIVGTPIALLLLERNATVTICHSRTQNIEELTKQADILVACCGRAHMIKKEWIKKGCIIIDVGINAIDDASRKRGYRLVGDVDYQDVQGKASMITPVPGGVGPMTIATLMKHTVRSAENSVIRKNL